MAQSLPGAVVYGLDLARVSAFYRDMADLSVESSEPDHVILRGPHVQLVVVSFPDAIAETIEVAVPPVRRSDTAVKLVFPVRSLAEARATASIAGGVVDPPEREWSYQGSIACDGHDLEGNVVQLRQPARAPAARSDV